VIGSAQHVLASTAPPLAIPAAPAQTLEHAPCVQRSAMMGITSAATAPESVAPVANRALSVMQHIMLRAAEEQVVGLACRARVACMGSTLQAAREPVRDLA